MRRRGLEDRSLVRREDGDKNAPHMVRKERVALPQEVRHKWGRVLGGRRGGREEASAGALPYNRDYWVRLTPMDRFGLTRGGRGGGMITQGMKEGKECSWGHACSAR